ncbi:hypothetical protein GCM10028807_31960 [Spirosoma daeguense]
MNTLDYFLKANLYGLLFVGCYWLFLRRHTFFGLNRAYLLLSAVLSLLLPLVSLPTQTVDALPVPVGVITLPVSAIATSAAEADINWENMAMGAYALIAVGFLLHLLLRTGQLLRFIRQSPQQPNEDYVLVKPQNKQVPTFSFFRYLILNPADSSITPIIDHELVHIRQHHSVDVLSLSLLRSIFWACPTLWLIDKMLRQVHEFLADKAVSEPTNYARFLVGYAFGTQPDTLVNGFFNPSLLKQRVLMLHQKATTRWALGKYVLVIPMALGLLSMTTAREEITAMISQATDERITVSGVVTSATDGKGLPGVSIVVKGGNLGTSTDANGKYTLSKVGKNESLVFSFVGHKTQIVPVNGRSSITVSLMVGATELNTVHVMGFEPASEETSQAKTVAQPSTGAVFTVVEQQPEYPGGMRALGQYLAKNLRYPAEARQKRVQGRVFLQFVVSTTGSVRDLRVLKGIGSGCDEEAIRVVSQMPNWTPGKQQGRPVNVQYNLPIQFSLEKADKRTGQVSPNSESTQTESVAATDSQNEPVNPASATQPGIKPNVTISGPPQNPFGGEPLFIVDGVEMPKGTALPREGVSEKNKLDINPNDIESINVLKGESAAVYGEKGKYGVIQITTKSKKK